MVGIGTAQDSPVNSLQPQFVDAVHLRWALNRASGRTGSIIDGYSALSALCRRPNTRRITMSRSPSPDSINFPSDQPGAVQIYF